MKNKAKENRNESNFITDLIWSALCLSFSLIDFLCLCHFISLSISLSLSLSLSPTFWDHSVISEQTGVWANRPKRRFPPQGACSTKVVVVVVVRSVVIVVVVFAVVIVVVVFVVVFIDIVVVVIVVVVVVVVVIPPMIRERINRLVGSAWPSRARVGGIYRK